MKEILPNIGYTSLPVLAISSLEDRGMQELKRELSSLCVRTPVEDPVEVDHVQKTLAAQFNYENDLAALSILKRSWQPKEKFQLSSKQLLTPCSYYCSYHCSYHCICCEVMMA